MKTDVWFSIWAAVAGDPSSGSGWAPNTSKAQEIVVLLVWDLENTGLWSSRTRTQSYLTVCSPMSLDMDYGIDILFPTFYRSFSFIASSPVTKRIISLYSQGLHSTLLMMVCWRPLQRWCCMQSCSIIVIGGVCFGHYGSFSRLLWLAMVSGTLWTLGGGTQRF